MPGKSSAIEVHPVLFFETLLLCSSGMLGTCYMEQAGLELLVFLPGLPSDEIRSRHLYNVLQLFRLSL